MDKQRLYTVTEAASLLGVTRQTVKNWISDGFIPYVKRNTCFYVSEKSLSVLYPSLEELNKTHQKLKNETARQKELIRQSEEYKTYFASEMYDGETKLLTKEVIRKSAISILQACGASKRSLDIFCTVIDGGTRNDLSEKYNLHPERIRVILNDTVDSIKKAESYKDLARKVSALESSLCELQEEIKLKDEEIQHLRAELAKEDKITEKAKENNMDRNLYKKLCTKLIDCNLSVRALRCAEKMNVETISDFLAFKKDTWMQLRNFGKKTLKEYEALINEMGLDEYWK